MASHVAGTFPAKFSSKFSKFFIEMVLIQYLPSTYNADDLIEFTLTNNLLIKLLLVKVNSIRSSTL